MHVRSRSGTPFRRTARQRAEGATVYGAPQGKARDRVADRARRGVALGAVVIALAAFDNRADRPGIIGDDDRRIVDQETWPWAAIGRVNRAGAGFCTGALVAPSLVLTAAHCLFGHRSEERMQPQSLHFLAGYRRGDFLAHAVARTALVPLAAADDGPVTAETLAGDWAILVLAAPIDTIRPLPMRSLEPSDGGAVTPPLPVMLAGYAEDRPHLVSADDGCRITGRRHEGRLLLHDCDTARGGSGSPLLLRAGDDVAIVGLVIGAVRAETADYGVAVSVDAVRPAIAWWRAGAAREPPPGLRVQALR